MPDSSLLRPPNVFLTVGVIFISGAAFFAFTGKVWVRFSGWVSAKNNREYFGGRSPRILSVVFFWSDTSCTR